MNPIFPRLRPADPAPAACKICGGGAPLYGVTDANRSCEEVRGKFLPLSGTPIYYRRCAVCGLLYTDTFDDWAGADFETYIYNADYAQVDADYEEVRPAEFAKVIGDMFAASPGLDILDYGGGNGVFAQRLRAAGFSSVATYDAFHPAHRERPAGQFDLITCFETLEHMPDPLAGAGDIAALLKPEGLVLFSTLLQPEALEKLRMQWWYIGPRNGHVTLHSQRSLATLWHRQGLKLASFNPSFHAAFRTVPPFASHLIRQAT